MQVTAPAGAQDSRDVAVAAARAAAEKQAGDVLVLEVAAILSIVDYFVVASGSSDRQVRTVVDAVEKALREQGIRPVRREGETEASWVLLDYVDVVVHVFGEEEREYYGLERLWLDAPRVPWEPEVAVSVDSERPGP